MSLLCKVQVYYCLFHKYSLYDTIKGSLRINLHSSLKTFKSWAIRWKQKSSPMQISKVVHCSYVSNFKLVAINLAKNSNNLIACIWYKGKDMTKNYMFISFWAFRLLYIPQQILSLDWKSKSWTLKISWVTTYYNNVRIETFNCL